MSTRIAGGQAIATFREVAIAFAFNALPKLYTLPISVSRPGLLLLVGPVCRAWDYRLRKAWAAGEGHNHAHNLFPLDVCSCDFEISLL